MVPRIPLIRNHIIIVLTYILKYVPNMYTVLHKCAIVLYLFRKHSQSLESIVYFEHISAEHSNDQLPVSTLDNDTF